MAIVDFTTSANASVDSSDDPFIAAIADQSAVISASIDSSDAAVLLDVEFGANLNLSVNSSGVRVGKVSIPVTITNPGGEELLVGWTAEYGNIGNYNTGSTVKPRTGSYYFIIGPSTASAAAKQEIDLSLYDITNEEIDRGDFGFYFGGYTSHYQYPGDRPRFSLRFKDENRAEISVSYGPQYDHNPARVWTYNVHGNLIPPGTRYVDLRMVGNRYAGTNCDAYFDDLFASIESHDARATQLAKEVLVSNGTPPESRATQLAKEVLVSPTLIPESRATQLAKEVLVSPTLVPEVRSTQLVKEVLITYDPPDIYNSVSAIYTMDNISGSTLIDDSGNSNNATISGAVQGEGLFGQGLHFNSKSDYVSLPSFSNTKLSVSLWYTHEASATWNTLLCRAPGTYHHLLIKTGTNQVCIWNNGEINSGVSLVPGQTYHFVITKSGTNQKVYLDRQLIINATAFDNSSAPLTVLGNHSTPGSQGALGMIDHVQINQNYVFNQTDVNIMYSKLNNIIVETNMFLIF